MRATRSSPSSSCSRARILSRLAERWLGDRSRRARDRRVQPDRRGEESARRSRSRSRTATRSACGPSGPAGAHDPLLPPVRRAAEQPHRDAGGVRSADGLSRDERLHGHTDRTPAGVPRRSRADSAQGGRDHDRRRLSLDVRRRLSDPAQASVSRDGFPLHGFRRRARCADLGADEGDDGVGARRSAAAQQDALEPDGSPERRAGRPLSRARAAGSGRAGRRHPLATRT